jgi:hypothetical protein
MSLALTSHHDLSSFPLPSAVQHHMACYMDDQIYGARSHNQSWPVLVVYIVCGLDAKQVRPSNCHIQHALLHTPDALPAQLVYSAESSIPVYAHVLVRLASVTFSLPCNLGCLIEAGVANIICNIFDSSITRPSTHAHTCTCQVHASTNYYKTRAHLLTILKPAL